MANDRCRSVRVDAAPLAPEKQELARVVLKEHESLIVSGGEEGERVEGASKADATFSSHIFEFMFLYQINGMSKNDWLIMITGHLAIFLSCPEIPR